MTRGQPIVYDIISSPAAEKAIATQFLWLLERTELHAQPWLSGLRKVIAGLGDMPKANPIAEETDAFPFEVRKALHGDYFVLYRILEKRHRIEVIGFRHGAQQPLTPDAVK